MIVAKDVHIKEIVKRANSGLSEEQKKKSKKQRKFWNSKNFGSIANLEIF